MSHELTIYDSISPNIIHSIFLLDRKACFANDDSQFTFVIHCLSKSRVGIDVRSTSSDAGTALSENSWDVRACIQLASSTYGFFKEITSLTVSYFVASRSIPTFPVFLNMLAVVLANTENISICERRQQLH